jgi:hypothetical protein
VPVPDKSGLKHLSEEARVRATDKKASKFEKVPGACAASQGGWPAWLPACLWLPFGVQLQLATLSPSRLHRHTAVP